MRSPLLSRWALAAALAAGLLAGCGGSDDGDGRASIRLLNATTDIAALTLRADEDGVVGGVATDTVSDYGTLADDTWDLDVVLPDSDSALASTERSLAKDAHYTVVAWGENGAVKLAMLSEDADTDDIDDGKAQVRVLNAATGVGSLDVYLTDTATDLESTTADLSSVTVGGTSSYTQLSAGSYRLRVTGAGDTEDLRLDLPALTLTEGTYATIVITPGPGGVLVHALLLQQQGALTVQKNTQARVRLIAGVAGNGVVAASVGSTALSGGLTSPSVGAYTFVEAGAQDLTLRVGGSVVSSQSADFDAGGDYTVMVYGTAADPLSQTLADDNRLPTSSSRAKMRLVHLTQASDTLTLTVDFVAVAENVPFASASDWANITSSSTARLDVTSPLSADPLYSATDVNLQALGVYTVFMLDGRDTPTGVLRKDR
jgi:Domain of unknown function (DUF4397)